MASYTKIKSIFLFVILNLLLIYRGSCHLSERTADENDDEELGDTDAADDTVDNKEKKTENQIDKENVEDEERYTFDVTQTIQNGDDDDDDKPADDDKTPDDDKDEKDDKKDTAFGQSMPNGQNDLLKLVKDDDEKTEETDFFASIMRENADNSGQCWDYLFQRHYELLGCKPDAFCRFDCSSFYKHHNDNNKNQCIFAGRKLALNSLLGTPDICHKCTCVKRNNVAFECKKESCQIQGDGDSCKLIYNGDQCCPHKRECNLQSLRSEGHCYHMLNRQEHKSVRGERIRPALCRLCTCMNPSTSKPPEDAWAKMFRCYDDMCDVADVQLEISRGCTPIYSVYKGVASCCPIDFICPGANEKVDVRGSLVAPQSPSGDDNHVAPKCIFSGRFYNVGTEIKTRFNDLTCYCGRPPIATCVTSEKKKFINGGRK